MSLGLYVPGHSPLHRLSAGGKLTALAVTAVLVSFIHQPHVLFIGLCALIVAWSGWNLSLPRLGALIRPLLWFLIPIAIFQTWIDDLAAAVGTVLAILILVIVAGAVSATTRPTDMLGALETLLNPLRRFGVDPQRASFAVTFVVRLVPFINDSLKESRDAIKARGGSRNPIVALAPVSVRLLRQADVIAEALDARGFGQRSPDP